MPWYGYGMEWVWNGMVETREGAPVAMRGWVLAPCAANDLLRATLVRQWATGEHGNR